MLARLDMKSLVETASSISLNNLGSSEMQPLELNLTALNIVGGGLSFAYVANLTSLASLSALTTVMGALSIVGNLKLPTCEATELRDRLEKPEATISANLVDECG